MPCYSTIKTKLTDGGTISAALAMLGYKVELDGTDVIGAKGENRILFRRTDGSFAALGYTDELGVISKKYAEIGLRTWAKKRGYAVTENDGTRITLVNRRS